jgi:hypothetical protein
VKLDMGELRNQGCHQLALVQDVNTLLGKYISQRNSCIFQPFCFS